MFFNEESSSAGAGTLLNLEGAPVTSEAPRKSSAHDFFSQLNWAEHTSGSAEYAPFQDHLGANSDSSSSDSDDEELSHHHDPFFSPVSSSRENGVVPGHSVPFVNFDDFESANGRTGQGQSSGGAPQKKVPTPQPMGGEEAKLIEFSIAEESGEESVSGNHTTPTRKREKEQTNNMFGASFDPWGTPSTTSRRPQGRATLEVSDLLGLNDSDEHSNASDLQSEVQTAGAETLSAHSGLEGENPVLSSNQFDPFGVFSHQPSTSTATPLQPQPAATTTSSSLTDDPLFNLLMNTSTTTTTSTTRPVTTHPSTSGSSDPFASLLTPTVTTSTNGASTSGHRVHHSFTPPSSASNLGVGSGGAPAGHRRVSQPPHINNHLSPLHGVSTGTGLGFATSYSQPNLSAFGSSGSATQFQQQPPTPPNQAGNKQGQGVRAYPAYMGGGSANTSPRSMSPTPFIGHSSSTGNLLQGGSVGGQTAQAGGMHPSQSSTSTASQDPFSQFNLGLMTGAKPTATSMPHKSPSQPVFRPQPGNAAPYQPYYMRQPATENSSTQAGSKRTPAQANGQAKPRPGAGVGPGSASSVFAQRKPNYNPVIGPESKTGKSTIASTLILASTMSCI